jgi:spermidine/putrescine-binding protein
VAGKSEEQESDEGVSRRDALKIGVFTAAGAAVGGTLGFFGGSGSRQQTIDSLNARLAAITRIVNLPPLSESISMFNWSLYTNYALLDSFEQKFKVSMSYDETAETQDDFRTKLRLNNPDGFDLMVVTGYAVQEAIAADLLEPLNHDYIPNIELLDSAYPTPWDPNREYSLPYLWGTTGIGWNSRPGVAQFPAGETAIHSFDQIFDVTPGSFLRLNAGKVTVQADRDEALAAAAIYNGRSINDLSPSTLQEIEDTLIAAKPYLAQFADATQYFDGLSNEDFVASHAWSGDVLFVRETANSDVTYTIPDEGAVIWTDNYVIPKNAPHKDTAMVFINHMWEASNAAVLAMFRNYMIANKTALQGGPKSQAAYASDGEPFGMILPHVWGLSDINPLAAPLFGNPPDPRASLMQVTQARTEAQNQELAALWERVQAA